MRMEQLEYLAAVTRLGSLRRAAEELHLSQPALSETLRNLERELGVDLLERRRSGAKISREGRELLPHIAGVLEAVDRLRQAADEQHQNSRRLRLGTVNAATVTLLAPAIREFRATHPSTQVEVITERQDGIQQHLTEGSFDLGLVSYLGDDDLPPSLHTTELLRGHPVVCIRPDSPLAALNAVTVTDLLVQPLIMMRSGYAMHRYIHRLLQGAAPPFSYSADGAEMCKLMVAEGLGVTVLPDYSVLDDPLKRSGLIICRPLANDTTDLRVVIQRRHARPVPTAEQDLHAILVRRATERRASQPAGQAGVHPAQPGNRMGPAVNGRSQSGDPS
ncbi:LysR family transcriptional regulator [Streptomyces zagrosensis]|uniref:DNA-binding transcriptional LysR family regulator n=1 Tax=Streptomyces zagrosensis TaxID=1042984 RepID=A0A7W9V0B0_9ACTN|nr:LysR family transcriptional regulator [Streptomyces zagrosensis]MBB5937637.1 DNA-binding transcriptional LysR family regulator [Streptomyces zagrosensis]